MSNDARYNPMRGIGLTDDCRHLMCDNCPEVWPYWWCMNQLVSRCQILWNEAYRSKCSAKNQIAIGRTIVSGVAARKT